jgi:hypothetical protein
MQGHLWEYLYLLALDMISILCRSISNYLDKSFRLEADSRLSLDEIPYRQWPLYLVCQSTVNDSLRFDFLF